MKIKLNLDDDQCDKIVIKSLLEALSCQVIWKDERLINLEQSIKDVLSFYGKEV